MQLTESRPLAIRRHQILNRYTKSIHRHFNKTTHIERDKTRIHICTYVTYWM